jgi:hypothetical protein
VPDVNTKAIWEPFSSVVVPPASGSKIVGGLMLSSTDNEVNWVVGREATNDPA